MTVGDLVKMNRGYSEPGLLLELISTHPTPPQGALRSDGGQPKWARILWPDHGPGLEKVRDLEVYNEGR